MDSETRKTEPLYEFLGWLEVNKKQVAIGAGAVVLIIGAIVTVTWYKNQQEFRASEALSAVRVPYQPSEAASAETLGKLQKVSAEYSGTAAALRAELIRAGLLFSNGKYAEAQAAFEKYVRDHAESRWVPEAVFGVAVCLDAQNKTSDAIAKYEDFARRFSTDPNTDQARLHLATLYEATGKFADAIKEYDKIVKAPNYSPSYSEAQERQALLLRKHPELAPTNPPPVTPTLPPFARTNVVTPLRTNLAPATNVPLIFRTNPPAPQAEAPVAVPLPVKKTN
jgi:tetratricopeptide (TPR) repeat protein